MSLGKRLIETQGQPPIENFNIVTYTGNWNGSNTNTITVGFQPDWIWLKCRSHADNHHVYDTNRGDGKPLYPNTDSGQSAASDHLDVTSTGFTLKTDNLNQNGRTFVAYCWKANAGTTSSNNDGDITSTVQANTNLGFAIATVTNNTNANQVFGHGLGTTPEWIIRKKYSAALNWTNYFTVLDGSLDYMNFNTTTGKDNSGYTAPDSTTFTVPTGGDWVFYSFVSIAGKTKIGTYTGNGTTGQSVTTGFKPDFVLIKSTIGNANWRLYDTVRGINNGFFRVQGNNAEDTGNAPNITMTSTGWEFTSGGVSQGINSNGNVYFYWALKIH